MIELTKADLEVALSAFVALEDFINSRAPGMGAVDVHITTEGDDTMVIGFGPSGEPAILNVFHNDKESK